MQGLTQVLMSSLTQVLMSSLPQVLMSSLTQVLRPLLRLKNFLKFRMPSLTQVLTKGLTQVLMQVLLLQQKKIHVYFMMFLSYLSYSFMQLYNFSKLIINLSIKTPIILLDCWPSAQFLISLNPALKLLYSYMFNVMSKYAFICLGGVTQWKLYTPQKQKAWVRLPQIGVEGNHINAIVYYRL
jgi:hypothetical protein